MTVPKFDEQAVFNVARQIDAREARRLYLEQACGDDIDLFARVEALLRVYDEQQSFLQPTDDGRRGAVGRPSTDEGPGAVIGPYKLLQQIGEGGMGIVFMAEQTEPVRRKVALKIIKPGMDSKQVIARFEAERQALAMMDHANIARVLDAGATHSGRPYFVMELVHGVPITKYCDDNHLTPRERLELFVPVCHAIQHAHQKGVIHRDIKPSNIMVTLYDGRPVAKVIDFGVAKATEQRLTERTLFTQYGTLVGTFQYMSPEQAEMSALGVDTRSDIYSLGVVLYELLTGNTPLTPKQVAEAAYAEVLRLIKEEEPPKPSTRLSESGQVLASISVQRSTEPAKLTKLVRGELDWIVMKCLEKDRNRRYETANSFAGDLLRYLSDEPVHACPPSARYRIGKFARRNKGPVFAASLVALALLGGVIGTTWGMLLATDAEADAKREARDKSVALVEKEAALAAAKANETRAKSAEQVAQENLKYALAAVDQMLTRVAEDKLLYVPQMEPVRRDLLLDAANFYEKFLESRSDDPLLRRNAVLAQRRLAGIYWQLRQLPDHERACRNAFEMFEKLDASASADSDLLREMVNCYIECCWLSQELGNRSESARCSRRAAALAEKLDKDPLNRASLVSARACLAGIAMGDQQFDEAEKILNESLLLADDALSLARLHGMLATAYLATGRLPEAERSSRLAVKHGEQYVADHPSTNWARSQLADDKRRLARVIATSQGQAEAEELLRSAVAIFDKLATDFPDGPAYRQALADAVTEEAEFLAKLGQTAEAENAYRRAIEVYEKLAADFPAMPRYQQATFDQRLKLGTFLKDAGNVTGASRVYQDAVSIVSKLPTDAQGRFAHWAALARAQIELGRLRAARGENEEAETGYRAALAIRDLLEKEFADQADFRRDLANTHREIGRALRDARRSDEAIRSFRMAMRQWETLAVEFPNDANYRQERGFIYREFALLLASETNHDAEADDLCQRDIDVFEKLTRDFPNNPVCAEHLAHAYRHWGFRLWDTRRRAEARSAFGHAVNVLEKACVDFPDSMPNQQSLLSDTCNILAWDLATSADANPRDPRRAVELAKRAVELAPSNADFVSTLGVAQYRARDWKAAIETLKASREQRGGANFASNVFFLAMAYWQQGDHDRARKCYAAAQVWMEKNAPKNEELLLFRGETAALLGLSEQMPADLEPAKSDDVKYYAQLVEALPEDAWVLRMRGELLARWVLLPEAAADLARAYELKEPNDVVAAYYHALLRVYAADAAGYRSACRRILIQFADSTNPDDWNNVAMTLGISPESGVEPSSAVAIAERAVADKKIVWRVAYLGMAHYRAGEFKRAADALEESLAIDANWNPAWVYSALAMARRRQGNAEHAEAALDKARLAHDQLVDAMFAGGIGHWPRPLGDVVYAELLYKEAHSLVHGSPPPDEPRWLVLRGRGLEAIGRAQEARTAFDRAFALAPDSLSIRLGALPPVSFTDARAQALAELPDFWKEHPQQPFIAIVALFQVQLHWGEWQTLAGRLEAAAAAFADAATTHEKLLAQIAEHAESGRVDEAEAAFAKAAELSGDGAKFRYFEALAHLASGDLPGYRNICAGMLDRFGDDAGHNAANWLAWTAALAPQAVDDANRPIALAEMAVASDPNHVQFSITLGAALYRAGRFGDAVARLDQANAAWEQAEMKPITHSPAYSWFFLAMAHQRLGHAEEARRWRDKAVAWVEQEIKSEGIGWNRRLTLELLRREAESVINGAPDAPPTDPKEQTGEKD